MVHPTAIVHPDARLDASVEVGPFAIIGADVALGPGCKVGPHVCFLGHVTAGARNSFHASCVIGDAPQDLKYKDLPTRVRIGDDNVFREHVTVHRSNKLEEDTVVGSNNFLMAGCHVGHNARVGDHVIMANGALLGGHATVGDRAFISGHCGVHQFTRVGALALMQGNSGLSKDLPPFTIARGINGMSGLNTVGLRRAGIGSAERLELRKLYHALFRSGSKLREAVDRARAEFSGECARVMLDFVAATKRGICADLGSRKRGETAEENSKE